MIEKTTTKFVLIRSFHSSWEVQMQNSEEVPGKSGIDNHTAFLLSPIPFLTSDQWYISYDLTKRLCFEDVSRIRCQIVTPSFSCNPGLRNTYLFYKDCEGVHDTIWSCKFVQKHLFYFPKLRVLGKLEELCSENTRNDNGWFTQAEHLMAFLNKCYFPRYVIQINHNFSNMWSRTQTVILNARKSDKMFRINPGTTKAQDCL